MTGVRLRAAGRPVERVAADVLVVGDRSPAAELATAARLLGTTATVLLTGAAAGEPIDTPEAAAAAESIGRSAAAGTLPADARPPSAAPAVARLAAQAMVCFCEDVRAADLRRECDAGYGHPELLKRRTGALTGPCQGKYCAAGFQAAISASSGKAPESSASPAPTTRPPARPVRLGDLVATAPREVDDTTTVEVNAT